MSKTLIERIIECRVNGDEKKAAKLFEQLVDENSFTDVGFDIDLEEDDKHPGFDKVADEIADKEGVSKEEASAILAASSRNASAKAKKANPNLNKVSESGSLRNFMNIIKESSENEFYKYIANGEEFVVSFADPVLKQYTDLVYKYGFNSVPEKVNVANVNHIRKIQLGVFQRSNSFADLIRGVDWGYSEEDMRQLARDFYEHRLRPVMKECDAKQYALEEDSINEVSAERLTDYAKKSSDKEDRHYENGEMKRSQKVSDARDLAQKKLLGQAKVNTTR